MPAACKAALVHWLARESLEEKDSSDADALPCMLQIEYLAMNQLAADLHDHPYTSVAPPEVRPSVLPVPYHVKEEMVMTTVPSQAVVEPWKRWEPL